MSVVKKGKAFYVKFRPFGAQIMVKTGSQNISEARQIEAAISTALRANDFRSLWPEAREVCIRVYRNQQWEIPADLGGERDRPAEEMTLWKGCDLFLNYPGVKDHPSRWRYEIALSHLVAKLGKDTALKTIWVPQLRVYQQDRRAEGAAADTINRELSTLSRLFETMRELQLFENNPVRLLPRLQSKEGQRQIYLDYATVEMVADACPEWFRPMIWTAYYTGMRRGEILGLTRRQVNLSTRLITLTPQHTKEAGWKRVPIHKDLVQVLEETVRVSSLATDKIFCLRKGDTVTELNVETFKNPWERACEKLKLEKPRPRFHDLRHTWKTNARRSGMHPEIEKAIMGHSDRGRSVHERYGHISDQELIDAIDHMTFHHGATFIFVAGFKK